MANQFDSWLNSNVQLSKSMLKETMQNNSSSQILGRKINSYYKVKKNSPRTNRPEFMRTSPLIIKSKSKKKNNSLSKSPIRCHSQREYLLGKHTTPDLLYCASPPRSAKKGKILRKKLSKNDAAEIKPEKPHRSKIKSILTDSLSKIQVEKLSTFRKNNEETLLKSSRKEKLEKVNNRIRKKNAKYVKNVVSAHPKPWGSAQRGLKEKSTSKSLENEEIRSKIRAEREVSKRNGRKAIGLEYFSRSKSKPKSISKEKKGKTRKSPDVQVQSYIKQKNKARRITDLQKNLEENLKERERIHALCKLDKTIKKKKNKVKRKKKEKTKKIKNTPQFLSEKLREMQDRVNNTYENLRVDAAVTIQRWVRSRLNLNLRKNLNLRPVIDTNSSSDSSKVYINTECEEWVSFLNPSSRFKDFGTNAIERFREKLNEKSKNIEKMVLEYDPRFTNKPESISFNENSSVPEASGSKNNKLYTEFSASSMSSQRFQVKRPKELDIDTINTPLITAVYTTFSSPEFSEKSAKKNHILTVQSSNTNQSRDSIIIINESNELCDSFKPSDSESSLENGNSSSLVKPEKENTLISSRDMSLHSFQYNLQRTEEILFSDKDSLEQDISEISSALMNEKKDIEKTSGNSSSSSGKQNISVKKTVFSDNSESQTDSKISHGPISSPNISESIGDIISEVIHQEILDFFLVVSFQLKEKEVDPSENFLEKYLFSMIEELIPTAQEILEAINTPGYQEPLSKMHLLQNTEIGDLGKFINLELILPLHLCSQLKIKFQSIELKSRQIYLQMLFDCVNEALNYIRPFGLKGVPDPWSLCPRTLFGEGELQTIFGKLKNLLSKWIGIKGGAYPTLEMYDDEDKLQALREERMSVLLCSEAKDEEKAWVEYEDEEAQTKFDLGEILFEELIKETVGLLQII